MLKREPAQDHRPGMKDKSGQQQPRCNAVMLAKILAPKKHRMKHIDAIDDYSQQKIVTIRPKHDCKIVRNRRFGNQKGCKGFIEERAGGW